ncbi:uncharacterized protein LOC133858485 [Alnus glutinosa]|uniref:uncharacterized protein LOC133858485 n=1 Tax=Alnus glutinosa TaxID=3517 RepID=UPI002D78739D|nr:uncharacterized protein LOC133858485 [Alnus glutinosa]XP_062149945.1 uncharacterized protein LOC133858485 [Alnus glutinosa]
MDEQPQQPNPSERKQSLVEPQAQQQPALHQSDADEDDENVKQLNECSSLYLSLQDCLIKTDRNWKSCQIEVQALKACNERRKRK